MANLNLTVEKTALLAMDYHNFLARMPLAQQRNVVEKGRKVLDGARQAGLTVIHIGVERRPDFSSARNRFVKTITTRVPRPTATDPAQMAEAMKIVDALAPVGNEPHIHKPRISGFYGSPLQSMLASKDIDTLVLMGLVTEFVVEGTARDAVDADYRVIVLEDCCAGFSEEAHKASIAILDWMTEIASSADFLESVSQLAPQRAS